MSALEVQTRKEAQRQKQRTMTIGPSITRIPAKWRTPRRADVVLHMLVFRARIALAVPMSLLLRQIAAAQPCTPASDQQNWGCGLPACAAIEASGPHSATSPCAQCGGSSDHAMAEGLGDAIRYDHEQRQSAGCETSRSVAAGFSVLSTDERVSVRVCAARSSLPAPGSGAHRRAEGCRRALPNAENSLRPMIAG